MIVRNYATTRQYRRLLVPVMLRVVMRCFLGAHPRALLAMLRVQLGRALRWLPSLVRRVRDGVAMPVTLSIVDDVACRAACSNCVFSAFADRHETLSLADLDRLFREALAMNVTNVYLMGADPFYRPNAAELLDLLARHRGQLFFLFTEGKRLDDAHLERIRRAGNVFPVLNVDGLREATDRRKGAGSFDATERLLERMRDLRMPFFVTTMVSRANFDEVASREYVRWLEDRGAWLLAYVPYTPVDRHADGALEMDAAMREALFDRSIALNREVRRLAILDLLGIEQHLTSCPAAVWSMCVYHDGTLTPCPAVAMGRADSNVRRRPLRDAFLNDPLYRELRALHAAAAPGTPVHCLFYTDPAFFKAYLEEHRDEVRVLNPGVAARIEQAGSGGSS